MSWKKIGGKLLFPPVWLMIIFSVLSAVALVYIFVKDLNESLVAYIVYVFAFYTLSVVCIFLGKVLPNGYQAVKQKIYGHPLGKRYMTDIAFKNHVSLYCSLAINLLYVGTNVFSAVWYGSGWSGVLAGYYFILAVMRFLLVRYIHRNKLGEKRLLELQCARICAIILLTLNIALFGVIFMILYWKRGFEYQGMLIYVMAMYAFYMTISAVADLVKYRKYNNPILSTSKVIKTAAALVSMLSLETAMFSQFGEEMAPRDQRSMIVATGAGISLIIVTAAVYMIVRTTRESNEIRRQNQNG